MPARYITHNPPTRACYLRIVCNGEELPLNNDFFQLLYVNKLGVEVYEKRCKRCNAIVKRGYRAGVDVINTLRKKNLIP